MDNGSFSTLHEGLGMECGMGTRMIVTPSISPDLSVPVGEQLMRPRSAWPTGERNTEFQKSDNWTGDKIGD